MLPYTNKVVYLRNGEFATLDRDGYEIKLVSDGTAVERGLEEVRSRATPTS